jgi:hypothetical protein
VLETDTPSGHGVDGPASLRQLESQYGKLPTTLTAESPSGSVHFYFKYLDGLIIRNSTSKIAPGIDVRGEGGMVVAPPSIKPGVGAYRWRKRGAVADAPDWLIELAKQEPQPEHDDPAPNGNGAGINSPYARAALERECEAITIASRGNRNDTLNRAAFSLSQLVAGGELHEHQVRSRLTQAAIAAGLEDGEIRATIDSGAREGRKRPRVTPENESTQHTNGSTYTNAREDFVTRLNQSHAIVRAGTKTLILDEQPDEPPAFMGVEDFHLWYQNDRIEMTENGRVKQVPVSRLWLSHPQRRQYSKVVFDPRDTNVDHFNLWRGFAVEPDPTKSCEKFLAHLRENICGGNEGHHQWLLGFLAHMVQRPWEKPGVAVALRGAEGVGKGYLAYYLSHLFPQHFVAVSNSKHLTGQFNAHLQRAILVFVDEAFWAGDKQGEGVLKHLVTDEHMLIEGKHRDAFPVKNLSRLLIASNEHWLVPAGFKARRWCVLDVADAHANDRGYFEAIEEERKAGAVAGLMHVLSTFDLSSVDVYTVPKTTALLDQKRESFAPHEGWWFECLTNGWVRYNDDHLDFVLSPGWPEDIQKERLTDSYRLWCRKNNIRSRLWPDSTLHKWLRKMLPAIEEKRVGGGRSDNDPRIRMVSLPSLEECRQAFADHLGQAVNWEEEVDEAADGGTGEAD